MIALFAEPIKAWCNGQRVILLGVRGVHDDVDSGLVNTEDGHLEYWPLHEIVTEWHFDPKKNAWQDVSEPEEDE